MDQYSSIGVSVDTEVDLRACVEETRQEAASWFFKAQVSSGFLMCLSIYLLFCQVSL